MRVIRRILGLVLFPVLLAVLAAGLLTCWLWVPLGWAVFNRSADLHDNMDQFMGALIHGFCIVTGEDYVAGEWL